MAGLLRDSKHEDNDAKMGRVAPPEVSDVYLETMEEAQNQSRELDKAGSAERKGMDSCKNSKGILAMCCDADCTGRSLKRNTRPCWILQYPDTVRASALMRLNRRVPNGTHGGVRGQLIN